MAHPNSADRASRCAQDVSWLGSAPVHLVVTSPPHGPLNQYIEHPGQLRNVATYGQLLVELDTVWEECYPILVPSGRVAYVVGDVCISRRRAGRRRGAEPAVTGALC